MKKTILIVFGILIFIILSFMLTFKFIRYKEYLKSLKGEKITDYIYHYNIEGEENYIPLKISDGNIYSIRKDIDKYSLYKRNIRSEKEIKIGSFEGENAYCSFIYNTIILCSNEKEDYYDYNLNLLYSKPYEYNRNNMIQLVYYQGKFLTLDDKKLYDNGNLIKEKTIDISDAYPTSNTIIGDNTYIIYYSPSDKSYIYYDIKNDKYKKPSESLYSQYDEGFYSTRTGKLYVYNLITDELKKYDNATFNNDVFTNSLIDNIFYFFESQKLYMVDLEKKQVSVVNYDFNDDITQILHDDEFIYLVSYDSGYDIYLIDSNKVNKTTYSIDEYNKYMNDLVDNKIKEMEDKYHIDFIYKDEVDIKDDTFEAEQMNNNYKILDALDNIETVLKKFNTEFFDSFHDEEHEKGLIIYLSGNLKPNPNSNTISNPTGYTLYRNDSYAIVADIQSSTLENTICHELMHNIEHKIWNVFPYDEWYSKNPMYFTYMYTYKDNADSKFTMFEENKNIVYFVDEYSKSWPTEDIARIFENICSNDTHTFLLDYPHLKEKALLLKSTLEENFSSLENTKVFDSLKE